MKGGIAGIALDAVLTAHFIKGGISRDDIELAIDQPDHLGIVIPHQVKSAYEFFFIDRVHQILPFCE